jgi:colanic acid/amylovoran biosynthesis glycosyltransferase
VRVAYVLKRYPRYSETFIVNEILAHEAAGLDVDIFSLRLPEETSFQDAISRVRSRVTYLTARRARLDEFWNVVSEASETVPNLFSKLELGKEYRPEVVLQAARLASEAISRGITHLHAHFGTEATAVARLASHFAEIPYTFTAHAKDIFHEYVVHEDLERKLRDAANVVTVSDFNVGYLRRNYGEAASGVRRIYNGLDLDRFPYSEPREREPRIVAIGRMVEKKGFPVLVEACRILADRGRAFECRIIGGGLLEEELKIRIRELGLEGLVEMAGPLPQSEIKNEIRSASAFAAPCVESRDGDRDGLPTVLLEAMAFGTPCVSTDVTGIPEVVKDGETGLMVSQSDALALADALERLLDDSSLRLRLAGNARAVVEDDFDVRRNAAKLRDVFGSRSFAEACREGVPV